MIIGAVAAVGFVVFAVAVPILKLGKPAKEEIVGGGGLDESPRTKLPGSAFLPPKTEQQARPWPAGAGEGPAVGLGDSAFLPGKPQEPQKPEFGAKIPTIEDLERSLGKLLETTPGKEELLALPDVPDAELKISSQGAKTEIDYVERFAVGALEKINFDNTRFAGVLVDENKLPLLPQQLIERGLSEKNDFPAIKSSLIVFRDYFVAKKDFEKSLEVYGDAISVAKELIAFDILMLELIDKAIAVAENRTPVAELRDFFGKFEKTAELRRQEFLEKIQIISYEPHDIFKKLAEFLGLGKPVFAQLPFGGPIGLPIFCICNASYWITVGPPVPPPVGSLLVSIGWIASPGLFPYKSLRPGAYWLGNYSAALPCIQLFGPFCSPMGVGNVPVIAGTSL